MVPTMDDAEKIEEQIQILFGVLPESFWTATAVVLIAFAVFVLIAFAVFAAAATVVLLILLFSADENFFIRLIEKEEQPFRLTVFSVVKNGFGLFLLIAGILMLVLPGQGILTVLISLLFLDFPGRRKLILKILSSEKTEQALNRIRRKFGKKPFNFRKSV